MYTYMDATHDFQECQPRITTPWAVSVKGTILVADLSFFWGGTSPINQPEFIHRILWWNPCFSEPWISNGRSAKSPFNQPVVSHFINQP